MAKQSPSGRIDFDTDQFGLGDYTNAQLWQEYEHVMTPVCRDMGFGGAVARFFLTHAVASEMRERGLVP